MLNIIPNNVTKIVVHTGNILSLNEIKKLAGQNQTDELLESLKITVADWKGKSSKDLTAETVKVSRIEECHFSEETDRESLKISVKIFVLSAEIAVVEEAVDKVLQDLNISTIDSLVVACKWDPNSVQVDIQNIWKVLEKLSSEGKLLDIGVSDVDSEVFTQLYNWAQIKPSIIQINLAVCCVVPPALQDFCKQNNVQLLTHSDPMEILSNSSVNDVLGGPGQFQLNWVSRFQIHVKCRGVLSHKGYLISVSRVNEADT